jgi:phosphonate transport system substrate-binding protein
MARPIASLAFAFLAAALLILPGTRPTPAEAAAARQGRPDVFRVGLIPNISPDQQRALYQPFGAYMQETLGVPVELFVATDYAGVVEALASDKIDMAYFGGVTYIQAETRAELYPIVTEIDRETGTTKYYSAIITRVDSPIQTTAEIGGKRFAFGDIASTSGSLYPRIMLDRAGIGRGENPAAFFENPAVFVYTGGHDATTLAVANGTVVAGGVEKRIMQRLIDRGGVDGSVLRIVEEALVQGYPWCVRSALSPEFVEQVTQAFERISDPDLLALMRAQSYTRVTAADYEEVRQEARRLGLVR